MECLGKTGGQMFEREWVIDLLGKPERSIGVLGMAINWLSECERSLGELNIVINRQARSGDQLAY